MARSPVQVDVAPLDVIIVGAGAAGLAAADALARAGRSVVVIEARDRAGGRCDTRRMPGLAVPVELGAEFIHGRPAETLSLLKRANVPAVDSTRTQRFLDRGGLRETNVFIEAQKAVRHAATLKKRDMSFAAFLERQRLPRSTRVLATMMVQGFDAADPARASARDIVEEWSGGALGASQMRPQGGYGPLLASLLTGKFTVKLRKAVREIRWRRGGVEVDGVRARRAVITLPLGVLQSGAVRFDPPLDQKASCLMTLASGPVIRVAMRFREAFWERAHPGVAFFHSPLAPFPTFWTPLPMRAPLLTAWAGGPKAARLTGSSNRMILEKALASVRSVLGNIEEPSGFLIHDWQADPYARGGYSYLTVGGTGAREALAAPLEETLYFAGEATDAERSGTVGGALASGERAAREILDG